MIRLREILDRIIAVMRRIGVAVRFLGGFTVIAGAAILAGTAAAGGARRGREAALLKTLGLTRAGVAGLFAAEHAAVGVVAGVLGAVGGAAAAGLAASTRALARPPVEALRGEG